MSDEEKPVDLDRVREYVGKSRQCAAFLPAPGEEVALEHLDIIERMATELRAYRDVCDCSGLTNELADVRAKLREVEEAAQPMAECDCWAQYHDGRCQCPAERLRAALAKENEPHKPLCMSCLCEDGRHTLGCLSYQRLARDKETT